MKKILLVALICLGGGQNLCAEVLDLRESSESTESNVKSIESSESNAESFGESVIDSGESSETNAKSLGESVIDSGESNGESIESTPDSSESKSESSPNQSALQQSNAFDKTGGFLGFEYGLGLVRAHIGEGTDAVQSDYLSAYINVIFGYQWYFLDADWAHLGLRVGGSVGYSSYGFRDKFVLSSDGSDKRLEVEAHNVRYGANLAFVWDFLDSYIHTLGIFIAPLGFEGNTIRGRLKERVGETTTKHKIATTTKIAYKLTAGAQYMFKRHHLLFAAYRLLYSDGKIQGVISIYGGNGSVSMRHSGFVGYAYKF